MLALPESDALLLITWDDSPADPRASPEVAGEVEGATVLQGHAPEAARHSFVLSYTPELGQLTTLSCKADWGILSLFSVPVSPRTEVRTPSLCEEVRRQLGRKQPSVRTSDAFTSVTLNKCFLLKQLFLLKGDSDPCQSQHLMPFS